MTHSRTHTSAVAADVTKLLLLNNRGVTQSSPAEYGVPQPNREPNLTLTLPLM